MAGGTKGGENEGLIRGGEDGKIPPSAVKGLRSMSVSMLGKSLNLYAIYSTAKDIEISSKRSAAVGNYEPLARTVMRQSSGWGAALGFGASLAPCVAAGPGGMLFLIIVSGLAGGSGFFAADAIARDILGLDTETARTIPLSDGGMLIPHPFAPATYNQRVGPSTK
jgi:hypothetical protein